MRHNIALSAILHLEDVIVSLQFESGVTNTKWKI